MWFSLPGIDPWDDSCDCYAMGTCPSQDLQVNSIPWISPAWIRTFLYKSFKFMVLPWIFWPWNSFVWHFNFLGSLALPFTEFCRFMVSPWISPAWIRTFLYKSFKFMFLPWISWPWIPLVWHFEFPRMLAFAEVTGSWFPHEFPLCELELLFAKVAWS